MQLLKRHVKFRHYLHEIERKFKNIMYIFSTELVKYSRVKQYSINQSTDLRHTIGMPSYKNSREAWFRFYMYMTLPTCDTWSNVSSRYIQLRVSPTFFFFLLCPLSVFICKKEKHDTMDDNPHLLVDNDHYMFLLFSFAKKKKIYSLTIPYYFITVLNKECVSLKFKRKTENIVWGSLSWWRSYPSPFPLLRNLITCIKRNSFLLVKDNFIQLPTLAPARGFRPQFEKQRNIVWLWIQCINISNNLIISLIIDSFISEVVTLVLVKWRIEGSNTLAIQLNVFNILTFNSFAYS